MPEEEINFYKQVYSNGCPACFRQEPQPAGLDIIYDDGNENGFKVHQDYEIPLPNFWIIEPKRHVASIEDLNSEESELFLIAWRKIRDAMRNVAGISRVTAFQQDKAGHFHFCLIPDEDWMKEKIPNYHPRDIQNTMAWARNYLTSDEGIGAVEKATEAMKTFLARN